VRAGLTAHGAGPDFDLIAEGETPGADPGPWAAAGCTWRLETRWETPHHSPERLREMRERIEAGPPRSPVQ
jgi:hypothetical protein